MRLIIIVVPNFIFAFGVKGVEYIVQYIVFSHATILKINALEFLN